MSSLWGEIEMEGLKEEIEYDGIENTAKTSKKRYYFIEWSIKLIFVGLGVFITVLLYNKCLFNPNCNLIVTSYFALLGLTCFLHAGFSIDKLANVKLT